MVQYYLPKSMRYSTLQEREEFYRQEFNLELTAEWFRVGLGKTKFAVVIGRHTKIYPQKYKKDIATKIIIDEYNSMVDMQAQIVEFLPEAVYYDRNIYDTDERIVGQELAFDLDPENITCPVHGNLEDKMRRQQGLSFCELELDMVKQQAIRLFEYLESIFSDMNVVYSGRGYHIHVLDKQAYSLSTKERLTLSREVKERGFQVDEWVSSGEFRLIRLPYSLNGLVSRIVLPLKKQELGSFDPVHDQRCLPRFLNQEASTF